MKVFGLQFDKQNIQNSNAIQKAITELYKTFGSTVSSIAQMTNVKLDGDKPFDIDSNSRFKELLSKHTNYFIQDMLTVVNNGTKNQWELANVKNDALVDFFRGNTKFPVELIDKWKNHNMEALKVFQSRKTDGRNLSDRVWETAEALKGNMGMAIDIALSDGRSANELSRDVRQYLIEPDKLFRRVRDKHGGLHLSKEAEKFSPGAGVYRSSYKNAMRLARTEINSAYRTADNERIQKLDFVVGIEIRRSNRVFECDVCNSLVGKYPKDFVFTGWHPQCRCFVLSILSTKDEFVDQMKNLLDGKETDVDSENTVYDTPPNFKKWIADNADSIEASKEKGTTPFWMKDNKNAVHRALNEEQIKREEERRKEERRLIDEQRKREFKEAVRRHKERERIKEEERLEKLKHTTDNETYYKNLTNEQYQEYSDDMYDSDYLKSVVSTRRDGYVATGNSMYINEYHRTGKYNGHYDIDNVNLVTKALDTLIEENQLRDNISMVRFIGNSMFKDIIGNPHDYGRLGDSAKADLLSKAIGQTLTDKGFFSCSTDIKSNYFTSRPFRLDISIKKGMNAYFADNLNESEVILGRGTTLKITGFEVLKSETVVKVEVIK